jgi:predicted N-acyltransferase
MRIQVVERLDAIDGAQWDALDHRGYPFLRYAFLGALERTRCIGEGTGWSPRVLTVRDDRGLAGALPAWLKTHSYGEFVFDFAWAQAYSRHGLRYYPKLIAAAPFTPATGPRCLIRGDLDQQLVSRQLMHSLAEYADEQQLSSAHVLFPAEADRCLLERDADWLMRRDCQFHWRNRGYADFEDFLGSFTADKRKKARRERRRVAEAGITFDSRRGSEAKPEEILTAWQLHRVTFLRRGNEPYLAAETFLEIARAMGESLLFKFARHGDEIVAVAVFFVGRDTLYGRYWGCNEDFHSLHFETCYHQGIEFCIEQRLDRFEPGTQGEHKVSRGFEPTYTYSAHRIAEPRFRAAIADYLQRESEAVERYAAGIAEHVPYRQNLET